VTAISLDNKETGIYRASVWKTTESKLTIRIKDIPELQSAGESEGKGGRGDRGRTNGINTVIVVRQGL
jgi:hypothetical protein